MTVYGQESINASYHHAKFGGHRHYGNGDLISLVCHVILIRFENAYDGIYVITVFFLDFATSY